MQENTITKNSNKQFLIIGIFISFIISLILYLYALWVSWYGALTEWLRVFVPSIVLCVINLILIKTSDKHRKISKIIGIITNIFIIFFVQIFICGLMTLLFADIYERPVTNIKDYKHALSSIGRSERIKHFPASLPENAQNIELKKEANNWFGSEEIYLAFDTDNEYIQQELSKYKFEEIEGPFDEINQYHRIYQSLYPQDLDKKGYKVYYIKKGIPGYYAANGIAVKNNRIMYFYCYPD